MTAPLGYTPVAAQLVLIALSIASAGSLPRFSMVTCDLALAMCLVTGVAGFASFALLVGTVQTAALCQYRLFLVHTGVVVGWLAWLWLVNPREAYWGLAVGVLLATGVGLLVRFVLLRSEASQQRIAELAEATQKARERERLLLARQLHDSVASELTRVSLRVSSVEGSKDAAEQAEALAEIQVSALGALHELSALVEVLASDDQSTQDFQVDHSRPDSVVRIDSLADARAEAAKTLRSAGFVLADGGEGPATAQTDSAPLVRVVRHVLNEGVTNILKYGQAGGRCTLIVRPTSTGIEVQLTNEVAEGPARGIGGTGIGGTGIGLRSVSERVRAAGGDFSISQAADTWILQAQLPYAPPDDREASPPREAPLRLGQTSPSS